MQVTRRHLVSILGLGGVGGLSLAFAGGAEPPPPVRATPEQIWADLLEGNRRFVAGRLRLRDLVHVRQELVKGQHPQVIVLTCSDSRVCPELIFDQTLGELFVIRTAGNVADPVALGSIEYAAEHLHARLLVVLGHENCGAVAAAIAGGKMPTAGLEALVNHIRPAVERSRPLAHGDDLARLVVTANIHQSAADLLKNSPLLREEVAAGKLFVIKACYRLSTGEVKRL